jgi:hypothetical protein
MVPAAGLTGAVLVALANYLVQRWRYRLDRIATSVDHLCEEINQVADLSTDYWLLDASQANEQKQAVSLEPRLVGGQIRLQSLILALGDLDRKLVLIRTEMLLVDFYEALTGGDFKVVRRATSPDRAQLVQSLAAQINGELRHAVSVRTQFWS